MDLLIVTSIVAIIVFLARPTSSEGSATTAWFGTWSDDTISFDHITIEIWPDGAYFVFDRTHVSCGPDGCRFEAGGAEPGDFVLRYGSRTMPLRALNGDLTTLETWWSIPTRDGPKTSRAVLKKKEFWSGSYRKSLPHGTWTVRDAAGKIIRQVDYDDGQVREIRAADGRPDVEALEDWRDTKSRPVLD
jgi:hypothetical protein